MLRRVLERLSRGRVVRRRLPRELGGHALFVSPDASLRLWHPDLQRADPLLLSLAAELVQPRDRVWDIGANVGLFAFAAAYASGPAGYVLAVEADEWLAGLLRRSAETPDGYAPVEVLAAAVADRSGTLELSIATRGRAGNHLRQVEGSTQVGGTREVRRVPTFSLDDLLAKFPPPDLVKIDVEGAEALCLRGAERLLSSVRPVLVCEVAAENAPEVGQRLERFGYRLFDAAAPADRRQPLASPVWNTLALPDRRPGRSPSW